ncbi:hypothetical protein AK830_g12273 [Neonectria ditissima]|uniref:UBA domain-containing protein n=1 Tax=Neonectria ditissima TaxID=78410 RepID=A0A0N8H4T9_9HYPO|nr:hypothetical protein AK830_g12273 [Neonectria ditissima]
MDDLSGLDWSSKPTGQPKQPVMNSAYTTLRPTQSPLASGRNTPLSTQGSGSVAPKPAPPKPSQDSFRNLMNFGPAKAKQNLTLAERQAQLEAEKRKKEDEKRKQAEAQFGNGQFWDTLGSRGSSASPAVQPLAKPSPAPVAKDDDDLFAAFNKDTKVDNASHYPPPESQRSTPANVAPINLSDPNAWGSSNGTNGGGFGVEDDDPFGLNQMKHVAPVPMQQNNDDDDFLGDLGRPVEEVRRKQEATSHPEPGKPIEDDDDDDSSSAGEPPQPVERRPRMNKDPFDRAVAQLVDYGFSAEDAQRALVESGQGYNAQAAVNWLLDEAHRKSKEKVQGRSSSANTGRAPRTANASQAPRSADMSPARADADLSRPGASGAASVGTSLFKTANSLWKTGQKKVQRAVADFQQDGDPNQPRWMREAQQGRAQGSTGVPDVTDEALMLEAGGRPQQARPNGRATEQRLSPQPPSRGPSPAQSSSRASPAPRWQQQAAPPTAASDPRTRLDRLASDDDFSAYSSPNRRKKTSSPAQALARKTAEPEPDLLFNTQQPKPSQSLPQRPAQRQAQRPAQPAQPAKRPPKPAPRPSRQIPSISPVALQTSTQHRLAGTAHFKRGDYAAAHSSYTSSLSTVPSTHPLVIVLLTNRALTALKTGEPKQAVDDADSALKIIGPGNGQGETVAVKAESGQDENRDMKELYGKALSRKAEALEQMEKWNDASTVWQLCVEGGVGGANAIKGRQRCQNALAPKPKPTLKPAATPRPKPSATASFASQKSSEAVTRLREANEAAAKEDDEKFALSEKIDAKVSAWRDGKRENLRALLGSLDQVLWENSGWKKVGLHELVMANKVKIHYMKAIAKTHPDKLPQDANTEVRLIAGLVFSTLNESWDKFKTENGL